MGSLMIFGSIMPFIIGFLMVFCKIMLIIQVCFPVWGFSIILFVLQLESIVEFD